jgi:hypothetical protein
MQKLPIISQSAGIVFGGGDDFEWDYVHRREAGVQTCITRTGALVISPRARRQGELAENALPSFTLPSMTAQAALWPHAPSFGS